MTRSSSILEEEKNYLQIMLMSECEDLTFRKACFICKHEYERMLLFTERVDWEIEATVEIIDVEKDTLHLSIDDSMKRREMFERRNITRKILPLYFPQDNFVYCSI